MEWEEHTWSSFWAFLHVSSCFVLLLEIDRFQRARSFLRLHNSIAPRLTPFEEVSASPLALQEGLSSEMRLICRDNTNGRHLRDGPGSMVRFGRQMVPTPLLMV